jgi:ATP-dependent Zn protease
VNVDSDVVTSLVYTWAPILLMVGFWLFFMRRMGTFRQGGYLARHIEVMERQEKLLERIAVALEQRRAP